MNKKKIHPAFGSFLSAVKHLKKSFPLDYPVSVHRKKLPQAGSCEFHKDKFKLCIDSSLSEDAAVLILLHEWAHAVSWNCMEHPELEEVDHNVSFGIAYSLVYRYFFDQLGDSPSDKKID